MVRESTSGRQNCGISDGRLRTARATAGFETFLGKDEISGGTETIREDCPDCSRNFRSIEIESELNAPCTLRVLKEPRDPVRQTRRIIRHDSIEELEARVRIEHHVGGAYLTPT